MSGDPPASDATPSESGMATASLADSADLFTSPEYLALARAAGELFEAIAREPQGCVGIGLSLPTRIPPLDGELVNEYTGLTQAEFIARYGPSSSSETRVPSSAQQMSSSPFTPDLPSALWQSINRFVAPREVVLHCARVNRLWRQAAAQPFSTKVLPADDDHSTFLSSRPGHIWPWKYNPFTQDTREITRKLHAIVQSSFCHQVRTWPSIPLEQPGAESISLDLVAQLKHLHTLHLTTETQWSAILALFRMRPFPFAGLHSLSLPYLTTSLIRAMPQMNDLRRLALVESTVREVHPQAKEMNQSNTKVAAVINLEYTSLDGVSLPDIRTQLKSQDAFVDAILVESERRVITTWRNLQQAQYLAQTWTRSGASFGGGYPRFVCEAFDQEALEVEVPTPEHWAELASKIPRLLYLDLPSDKPLTPQSGILELIRRLELRQVEGANVFADGVLERLIGGGDSMSSASSASSSSSCASSSAPSTLESLVDCWFEPVSQSSYQPRYVQAALTDRVLRKLALLPALAHLNQPRTELTSIEPLTRIGHLREWTLAGQPLSASLAVDFGRVFPQLKTLRRLTVRNLQAPPNAQMFGPLEGQEAAEQHYLDLLRAIRTLPALDQLVLAELPLLQGHLAALLADEPADRAQAGPGEDAPLVGGLDDDEPAPLAPCVLRLSALYLLDLNQFMGRSPATHRTLGGLSLPSMTGLFADGPAATPADGRYFEVCLRADKLPRTCRVQVERVPPMDDEMKARWRRYFVGASMVQ